jgi:hypothetical protein
MVGPIVVAEGEDVTFHRTVEDVGAYYEVWFPDSVEHRAFDAEGRRLELYADPPVVPGHGIGAIPTDAAQRSTLCVRAREAEPSGADELGVLLRELLRGRRDHDATLDDLTLPHLLDLAVARVGFLP